MLNYVIRRLLLMVPTLVGITALVFFVVALSPGGIGAVLASQEMGMRPAEREALRRYYNKRYGLNKPAPVQYARWLNKVSPVGFRTWAEDDRAVVAAEPRRRELRAAKERELAAAGRTPIEISRALEDVTVGPEAGDLRLSRPAIKLPDLGESYARGRSVSGLIMEALPVTLMLNAISLPLTYGIATLSGLYAARHRGRFFDVASGTIFLALWSFPVILAGVLLIGYLGNVQYVKWFPAAGLSDVLAEGKPFLPARTGAGFEPGWLLDRLWHLALPVVCLSYGHFAFLAKLARGAVLENMRADYVRTARAKGVGERDVLFRHVFANSLIPLITQAAYILPALIAGSVVVETIFSVPGMGKLLVDAIKASDRELFLSITLCAGLLGLVGYLLADILYAVADPRVSYE
jgi:ABC-type dipeptide/oligopeptide/nickel transport system permease component